MLHATDGVPPSHRTRSTRFIRLVMAAIVMMTTTVAFTACDSSSAPDDSSGALDAQITDLLNSASNGQGPAFFTMPASDDYAAIPHDPRNPITAAKVELGKMLYHETALTTNPKNPANLMQGSCASCHHVDAGFQAGMRQGIGTGGLGFGTSGEARHPDPECTVQELDVQQIRSPSAMNLAWQPDILWNGQFGATDLNVGTEAQWTAGTPKEVNHLGYEGLEIQAIAAQTVHRMDITTSIVPDNAEYRQMFAAAFPAIDASQRMTPENAGLAIAAYERTLLANHAPWQRWLGGNHGAMTDQQKRGAILFFGKANCVQCHTGPALASMAFYGLGMGDLNGAGVEGYDPTAPEHKGRGGFTGNSADLYHFKVPQLYNLTDSPFYGHGGTFNTIREVIEYKNLAVPQNANVPQSQLSEWFKPLNLTDAEIDDLVAFLSVALHDDDLHRYVPTAIPSGYCFPDNDPPARADRGCQ